MSAADLENGQLICLMAGERILTVDWDGSTGKWTLGEFKGHVLAGRHICK